MMNRRNFARAALLASFAAPLGACAVSTVNGVTTVTLNVASVVAWGNALVNGAKLVASLPGIPAAASAGITVLAATLTTELVAFQKTAGNSVTLTFDATSAPAAVTSLLADGKALLADAQGVLSGVAASYVSTAQTYVNAISTIVSIFSAAMGTVAAAKAPVMTESTALAVLR